MVAHILQFIQLNLIDEVFPVDNQERKTPEGLLPLFHEIDRIEEQHSGSALLQLKRSCNRVLFAVPGQSGLHSTLRIFQHIKTHGRLISLQGIDLVDDTVLCHLVCLNNLVFILHQSC